MNDCQFLGIDLAKNVFQLHGASADGKVVFKKRLTREQLAQFLLHLPPCVVAMEACASANHWGRVFTQMGHQVKLISPQFVKPFVKGNKTDGNDAEAICEALQRPTMRFVPIKSVEQQDIQSMHRIRSRLVNERTGLVCQIRGILAERGIVFAQAITRVRREVPVILADQASDITPIMRALLLELMDEMRAIDVRIGFMDRQIETIFKSREDCQRIAKIAGVGPKTATAFIAAVGNPAEFKNGRHFAAWLGLVPRQHSSGDKVHLMGISKRGDKVLRTLLVHGARAVLRTAPTHTSSRTHQWAIQLAARRGPARAIIAIANKMARVIWVLLAKKQEFQPT